MRNEKKFKIKSTHTRLFRESRGSSIIEYAVLIGVVTAGIIVASYYVPRAWNGYIKGESDGIQDSYNDPFTLSDATVTIPGCSCSDWQPTTCGSGSCGATEMNYQKTCTPLGCNVDIGIPIIDKCVPDANCCEPWVTTGLCGANGGCPDGFIQETASCGNGGPNIFQCKPDNSCIFKCGNDVPTPHGTLCPLDDTGLTSSLPYTYVDEGNCSNPAGSPPKCQIECQLPFVPQENGGCDCPDGYFANNEECILSPTKGVSAGSVICDESGNTAKCGGAVWTAIGGGFEITPNTPTCNGAGPIIVYASSYPVSNELHWHTAIDDYAPPTQLICLHENSKIIGDTQLITVKNKNSPIPLYAQCPVGTYLLGGGIDAPPSFAVGDYTFITSRPEWDNNRWKCHAGTKVSNSPAIVADYECSALCGTIIENKGSPKNIQFIKGNTASCANAGGFVEVFCPTGTKLVGGGLRSNQFYQDCPSGGGGLQWWTSIPIETQDSETGATKKGYYCRSESSTLECTAICVDS